MTQDEKSNDLLEKFSSLSKLRRVIAYCCRFIQNCRKDAFRSRVGSLEADNLRRANTTLARITQRQAFAQEIEELNKKKKRISRDSRILSLNPFLDKEGILRVGGRLKNADLSCEQ